MPIRRFSGNQFIVRLPIGRGQGVWANGQRLEVKTPNNPEETETWLGIKTQRFAFFDASGQQAKIEIVDGQDTYRATVQLSGLTDDGAKLMFSTDVVDDNNQTASVPTGNLTPVGFAVLTPNQKKLMATSGRRCGRSIPGAERPTPL